MAAVGVLFNLTFSGSATTVSKDDWYDIGALSVGGGYSPIPTGVQLWLGLMMAFSQDKGLSYEIRVNNSGQSTGTVSTTELIGVSASDPASGTTPCDLFYRGAIQTLAPAASSTGVEKLWLRVESGTATSSTFDWFIYFTTR